MLKALSLHHEESGYVQGMGYVAGVLLMHMEEQQVFEVMNAIFTRYNMKGYYLPCMPRLYQSFYVFMNLLRDTNQKVFNNFVSNFHRLGPNIAGAHHVCQPMVHDSVQCWLSNRVHCQNL